MRKLISLSLFIAALFVCAAKQASAQYVQDNQGRPLYMQTYTDVQGNPYLINDWTKGVVKLLSGKSFTDMQLKYDLVSDQVFFKDPKSGQGLKFIDPVMEFKLMKDEETFLFKNGFKAADGNTGNTYYEILFDGGTQLLKRNIRRIQEERVYNSASTTKIFESLKVYYLSKDKEPVKIKNDKKQILTVLGNRSAELEQFIKDNKLNLKEEADLVKLIAYYNSL